MVPTEVGLRSRAEIVPKSFAVVRNKTAQNHASYEATSEPPRSYASGNNACRRRCEPCRCRKRDRCDGGGDQWWSSSARRLCEGIPPAAGPVEGGHDGDIDAARALAAAAAAAASERLGLISADHLRERCSLQRIVDTKESAPPRICFSGSKRRFSGLLLPLKTHIYCVHVE